MQDKGHKRRRGLTKIKDPDPDPISNRKGMSHKFTRGRVSSTTKIKDPSVPTVTRYQGILHKRTTVGGSF